MSELTNAYGSSADENAAYVASLLALLGDRDPLAVMAELLPALDELCRGLSPAQLRRPEREGKWSIVQVAAHLADSEIVLGYRYRMMLAQSGSTILGYDQDAWARELRYDQADLDESRAQIAALRTANLRLLRSAQGERLERYGLHSERGRETLGHMLKMVGGHDLLHRRQIARIRAAIGA
jgi:uncharacterized damage-inducible protein DinB